MAPGTAGAGEGRHTGDRVPPRADDDLASRVVAGDRRAWREMVDGHRAGLVRLLLRTTGDPEAVRDLEQDLWTRMLAGSCAALRPLCGRGATELRTYLCTVALNLARDHGRRAAVRRRTGFTSIMEGEALEVADADDPEMNAAARERREQLLEAAAEESRETRERDVMIFIAYYGDGYTTAEIAAMGVGIGQKGVEAVLHRLSTRLRARFAVSRGEA